VRYKSDSIEERDAAVERLREFLRFSYVTGNQVAQWIGVRDTTIYSILGFRGKVNRGVIVAARIVAFLDSLPEERSGFMPIGYEYREYKNWRGIPKPRRCPFCKQAKGEIRKVRGAFQGVRPSCGATGPKRDSYDGALMAWNGKDAR
jgi:hypothetical protein